MNENSEERNIYCRTEMLLGKEKSDKLRQSSVIIFGVGGVGSFAIEALARSGIGKITMVDNDKVDYSNINRQLTALHSTIGKYKCDVMKERVEDINPNITVNAMRLFYGQETESLINLGEYDYIIDAIDTVASKILIVENAVKLGVQVISSMGTGNKIDPSKLVITDISKTNTCPLARVMRKQLRDRGIQHLKVLFSTEEPLIRTNGCPGSIAFVPSSAGLMIAGEVIRDISMSTMKGM